MGRPVGQGLVGPLGVVVIDVSGHGSACFLKVLEGVEPGAFLFEGADETLAEAVLFGSVGRDAPRGFPSVIFLLKAVVLDQGSIGP